MVITMLGVPAQAAGLVRSGIGGVSAGDSLQADETSASVSAEEETSHAALSSTIGSIARSGITTVTADQADMYVASASVQNVYNTLCQGVAIANVPDYVNVRAEANTEADVLGKVFTGCSATILETVEGEGGQWYHIESGSVNGYIMAEYFLTGEAATEFAMENGRVYIQSTEDGLRVHESASLDSETTTTMYVGQTAQVLALEGDFIKVSTVDYEDEEVVGYVFSGYTDLYVDCDEALSIEEEQAMLAEQARIAAEEAAAAAEAEEAAEAARQAQAAADAAAARAAQAAAQNNAQAQAAAEAAAAQAQAAADAAAAAAEQAEQAQAAAPSGGGAASGARGQVVNYAYGAVGSAYVWGASGGGAYDCSGLVMAAYGSAGVGLPHYSGAQAGAGQQIPVSSAQPGDILWMPGHVGIYVGNGQCVEASSPGVGVIVSNAFSGRWSCAVNVLG
jgi:cell wall-associated NlpC family hydrolase